MNETDNGKKYSAGMTSQEGAKQVIKTVPLAGYMNPTPKFDPGMGSNGMESAPKFKTNC